MTDGTGAAPANDGCTQAIGGGCGLLILGVIGLLVWGVLSGDGGGTSAEDLGRTCVTTPASVVALLESGLDRGTGLTGVAGIASDRWVGGWVIAGTVENAYGRGQDQEAVWLVTDRGVKAADSYAEGVSAWPDLGFIDRVDLADEVDAARACR